MQIHLSNHAQVDLQQRGIRSDAVDLIAIAYDICARLPGNRHVLAISAARAQQLRAVFGNAAVERAARLRLIVDMAHNTILSAIKSSDWKPSRHRFRRHREG